MKLFFTLQLCLILGAGSHAAMQDEFEEPRSSQIGGLKSSLSALPQNVWSWMDAQKEKIGPIAVEAIEESKQL